jgi:hypothetical protein
MIDHPVAYGKKVWAFAAGNIPLRSTGLEPDFTSHDKISILNTSAIKTEIEISIYYEHADVVTDHQIVVGPGRVRKIRFNDLIDPLPIPLDTPFGFVVTSPVPVIVQFSRMNTGDRRLAEICTTAFNQ